MKFKKYLDYFFFIGRNWNYALASFTVFHEIRGEQKYNLDTAYTNDLKEEEIVGSNKKSAFIYQPVNYYILEKAMKFLIEEKVEGGFVDFGCGYGRILVVATRNGFNPVKGVEFVPVFCNEARKNMQLIKSSLPQLSFEIFCGDATTYSVKSNENVFCFFNPFDERVMLPVVKNILRSLKEVPRKIYILYFNPTEIEIFLSAGFKEIFYHQKLKYLDVSILVHPGI